MLYLKVCSKNFRLNFSFQNSSKAILAIALFRKSGFILLFEYL